MADSLFFDLTPDKNGGESIHFSCEYPEIGLPVEQITLESYGSSATITAYGVFTSENLFKLAKELQKFELRQQLKYSENNEQL